jgi:hypothetical protein
MGGPEVTGVGDVMSGRGHGAAAPRLGFWLPESKFHPPAARTGIVARTALVERLAATQAPVITVMPHLATARRRFWRNGPNGSARA